LKAARLSIRSDSELSRFASSDIGLGPIEFQCPLNFNAHAHSILTLQDVGSVWTSLRVASSKKHLLGDFRAFSLVQ